MESPRSRKTASAPINPFQKLRTDFSNMVKSGTLDATKLRLLQDRLDTLAEKYPPEVVSYGHLMYLMQSQLSYYSSDYAKARRFLDIAIDTNGDSWEGAEAMGRKINKALSEHSDNSRQSDKTTAPVGIGGWLILPIAGLILTILMEVLRLPGIATTDYTGIGGALAFDIFSVIILVGMSALSLWYIFTKSTVAKKMVIATYIASFVMSLATFIILLIIFTSNGASESDAWAYLTEADYFGAVLRSGVLGFLWSLYFLCSKRVSNTMVK